VIAQQFDEDKAGLERGPRDELWPPSYPGREPLPPWCWRVWRSRRVSRSPVRRGNPPQLIDEFCPRSRSIHPGGERRTANVQRTYCRAPDKAMTILSGVEPLQLWVRLTATTAVRPARARRTGHA
jgi:hypothetical protein